MDIQIIHHGSIAQLMPLTDAGAQFLQHNLEHEGWQWMGRSLCVEPRFVQGIWGFASEHGIEMGE